MESRRLSVIDVGSNTVRSLIVEVYPNGAYSVLDDERETVRLAKGLRKTGRVSVAAINRTVVILKRMKEIARGRGVRRITAVATNAIRDARNGKLLIERARREAGLRVNVISGEEEARLTFESAAHQFDLGTQQVAAADVGGGSSELVLALGTHIEHIYSMPIGALTLTESHLLHDPPRRGEYERLARRVRRTLKKTGVFRKMTIGSLIASGGTANALAHMAMARKGLSGRSAQGFEMTQADVRHVLYALLRRSLPERIKMPGLSPERAEIIIAGVTILDEMMSYLRVNALRVNTGGIRDAMIRRMIVADVTNATNHRRFSRVEAAEAFGRSLGYEQRHVEHVRDLALSMFDQVVEPLQLDPAHRDLLAASALLHDIGTVVSYLRHHKHSYHLIAHAPLEGFSPGQVEIIAQVARYHRASVPKKKHAPWKALSREDRQAVRELAAILRLADSFDRRHSQGVRRVLCRATDRAVRFMLSSGRDISVEIHGAMAKKDLFEKVFGRVVRFDVVPSVQALQPELRLVKEG